MWPEPPSPLGARISPTLAARIDAPENAPDLRIAGRLLHLYTLHGAYRGAWVPSGFAPLSNIELCPHMLSDHRGESILAALKGVRARQTAPESPPQWTPFDQAADSCACCGSLFSWESLHSSASQQICSRHHCRGCGRVVCNACSKGRQCFAAYGIVEPSRCCDACYFRA